MTSLRKILSKHAPALVLDAASSRIQAGLFETVERASWVESEEEAGTGVFRCVESLGIDPAAIGAFIFAAAPGSILGIRTVAMALRTWTALAPRPVFAYHGLAVVAQALGRPDLGLIADARREAWHWCRLGEPLRRVPASQLTGALAMPEGFRHWSALPAGLERVSYRLAELLPRAAESALFDSVEHPDAFLHEEPRYAAWQPQIHRAP